VCAELAVPLLAGEETVGVLDCQSDQPSAFKPAVIQQIKMFCSPAALAVKNAQRFAREQRRRAQLEAVNAVARETTSVFDLDQLLDRLCEVILHNFPADQVSIVMYDEGYLTVAHFRGKLTSVMDQGERLPENAGLCARALATGAPVLDNQVRDNSGYIAGFEETHSEVCLPLISFSEPLGVLILDSAKADAFDPEEIHAMQAAADVCATAIQNARHFERARNLANVDGLTGIYNRRYFEQRILEELERSVRYNGSMALLMIDIDHFKKLNDEFGHLLGDEVLRQVSSIFEQHLRKLDVVCRYGGEEFAILVPETPGSRATAVAEKLRKIIESWNFPGVPRPVTISIGVAEFPTDGRTRDELMKAADDALYSAKQQGRNRVVAAQRKVASGLQPA
jgi:diguanylate cyclase (GGDEF)-like protein